MSKKKEISDYKADAENIKKQLEENGENIPADQGMMMFMSIQSLKEAGDQASGKKKREVKEHKAGFQLAISNEEGNFICGLWSCWLENRFVLGFGRDIDLSEEDIKSILGVELASPVVTRNAWGITEERYNELKAQGGTVGKSDSQFLIYDDEGSRTWAKYYGPIEETGGRVWVDDLDFDSYAFHLPVIVSNDYMKESPIGHNHCRVVSTYQFSNFNEYAPEGPTANSKAVMRYREKFIELFAKVAINKGCAKYLTINYSGSMVPEDLEREGYQNIKWHLGSPGSRQGWGKDVVSGEKNEDIVFLKSANSLVPWLTIRRINISDCLKDSKTLSEKIISELNF